LTVKHWFVYIILSDDQRLYTGITTDMQRRWSQHSSGKAGARFFRGRKPQQLCLIEPHADRSSASKREYAIKQLTREEKLELLITQAEITRTYSEQLMLPVGAIA